MIMNNSPIVIKNRTTIYYTRRQALGPIAKDCCIIVTNSGALCRKRLKRQYWRQTDKQTYIVNAYAMRCEGLTRRGARMLNFK